MTVHDQRWIAALAANGYEVLLGVVNHAFPSIESVREAIAVESTHIPVVAGPLTTVTKDFMGVPNPVIGLSWGFDLLQADIEELTWLTGLHHLIVDSLVTRDIATTAGVASDCISIIPWGVDLGTFTMTGTRMDLGRFDILPDQPTVLSLRAHESLYRVQDLIQSWPRVCETFPNAIAMIGNRGSLTNEYEEIAQQLGVAQSIRFIGHFQEGELPELMRSVSTYASTSPVDGSSVTLLQAMACGVPVITTDTLANRDWIDPGETGRLYSVGNPEDLASKIIGALDPRNREANALLSTAAHHVVLSRANWQANSAQLRGILERT